MNYKKENYYNSLDHIPRIDKVSRELAEARHHSRRSDYRYEPQEVFERLSKAAQQAHWKRELKARARSLECSRRDKYVPETNPISSEIVELHHDRIASETSRDPFLRLYTNNPEDFYRRQKQPEDWEQARSQNFRAAPLVTERTNRSKDSKGFLSRMEEDVQKRREQQKSNEEQRVKAAAENSQRSLGGGRKSSKEGHSSRRRVSALSRKASKEYLRAKSGDKQNSSKQEWSQGPSSAANPESQNLSPRLRDSPDKVAATHQSLYEKGLAQLSRRTALVEEARSLSRSVSSQSLTSKKSAQIVERIVHQHVVGIFRALDRDADGFVSFANVVQEFEQGGAPMTRRFGELIAPFMKQIPLHSPECVVHSSVQLCWSSTPWYHSTKTPT